MLEIKLIVKKKKNKLCIRHRDYTTLVRQFKNLFSSYLAEINVLTRWISHIVCVCCSSIAFVDFFIEVSKETIHLHRKSMYIKLEFYLNTRSKCASAHAHTTGGPDFLSAVIFHCEIERIHSETIWIEIFTTKNLNVRFIKIWTHLLEDTQLKGTPQHKN